MAGDFKEVLDKLAWAKHQVAVFNLACSDYIDQDPYVAEVIDDPEAQAYRIVARLRYPPPASLAHAVGECLSNLHGVLDYLAAQLVYRARGQPDHNSVFPIRGPNPDGTEPWVNITTAGKGGRGEVAAIKDDPVVIALLRRVQPYHDGVLSKRHFLEVLRTLNGLSKHHKPVVLVSAVVGANFMTGTRGGGVGTQDDRLVVALRRVEDGDEIVTVRHADAPDGCSPDQAGLSAIQIALEGVPWGPSGDPIDVRDVIADMGTRIEHDIVTPFRLLF